MTEDEMLLQDVVHMHQFSDDRQGSMSVPHAGLNLSERKIIHPHNDLNLDER